MITENGAETFNKKYGWIKPLLIEAYHDGIQGVYEEAYSKLGEETIAAFEATKGKPASNELRGFITNLCEEVKKVWDCGNKTTKAGN